MKPILFNTEMVRAIQVGRKTVTRRVVKPQPVGGIELQDGLDFLWLWDRGRAEYIKAPCHPGDILYARETWYKDVGRYMYKANYSDSEKFYRDGKEVAVKWHPSIHMPRKAARIFLRVTDVRVERLRDVTGADAKREGFSNRGAFIRELLTLYPDCTTEMWLWVIEFERISREEANRE